MSARSSALSVLAPDETDIDLVADSAPDTAVAVRQEMVLALFTEPQAFEPLLARVRAEIKAFKPDTETSAGRKAIASFARKIAKYKVYLDGLGKKLVDEQKEIPKKIDASRKELRETLDAWRDEARKPLTDWEAAEERRVNTHRAMLKFIADCGNGLIGDAPQPLGLCIFELETKIVVAESYEEFETEAHRLKSVALVKLRAALAAEAKRIAEQEELDRLRKEAADRAQRDRDEAIAKAAADAARAEALAEAARAVALEREAAALREAELKRANEEALRQAAMPTREQMDAAAAAEIERLERERDADRAAAAKLALTLKQDAIAAQHKATEQIEVAKVEAANKARAEAEAAAALAMAAKTKADAEELAAREADRSHRGRINGEALAALLKVGVSDAVAKQVITLAAKGEVPHMKMVY